MAGRLIEDYALIGDCETAALVGRDGSIEWLCWPRFDSDACFAALLGDDANGRWLIAPADSGVTTTRRYLPDTLVLETRHETDDAAVTVTDFMPPRGKNSDVVRIVRGERGTMRMSSRITLRFGYGSVIPWVTRLDDGTIRAVAGPDMVVLHATAETHGEGMETVSDFTVSAGEVATFVLTYAASHEPLPEKVDPEGALYDTIAFWTEWAGRFDPAKAENAGHLPDEWVPCVKRSLMLLKALTYRPSGGIVAAATTSLPEKLGGERNWDYRFCWLRDASITLFALMNAGYYEEAEAWRDWLIRAMAGSVDQLQIMYGVLGERRLMEWEADWLSGFEGSKPVRIGNAAHGQMQLDVYGEVMICLHRARAGGLPESGPAWSIQCAMLGQLEALWTKPDSGIWESRAEPRHYVFSKVMAWAAFDRGIKSAEEFGLDDAPLDHWRALRRQIHDEVCREGFDPGRNTFVQHYGSPEVDASLLLLPIVGFLEPTDPRIAGTVAAIEEDLLQDGFVLRYRTHECADGLPPGEGAFLACSFWLAENYALIGRVDEAKAMVDRLIGLTNDVGLLSEEYDAQTKRQLGNTPQAFSHVTLIAAAFHVGQAIAAGEQGESMPTRKQTELIQA